MKHPALKSFLLIFLLSSMGMGLWLFEIVEIKGWHSLTWLNDILYTPFIATLFCVTSFIIPFDFNKRLPTKNIALAAGILYLLSITSFFIVKEICYLLYCRICFWSIQDLVLILSFALALFLFLGFSYRLTTDRLIRKNKKINIIRISFSLILVIPFSMLSIQINKGFGQGMDWVDAVKMGYPIFYTTLLLGTSGVIISRQAK